MFKSFYLSKIIRSQQFICKLAVFYAGYTKQNSKKNWQQRAIKMAMK